MDLSAISISRLLEGLPSDATVEQLDQLELLLRSELAKPSPETPLRIEAAYEALQRLPSSIVCASRVACLLCVTSHYYDAGRCEAAVTPASDAVAAARQLGDPIWVCKALKLLGSAYSETRNLPAAVECYSEAIELARTLCDARQESGIWLNTGIAHYYAAQFGDAVACYEKAIELGDAFAEARLPRERALANLALAALYLGDIGRGLKAIQQAIASCPTPSSAHESIVRTQFEHHYTRLLLEAGLVDEARKRARLAKQFAAESGSARAKAFAAMAEGLTEIHAGNNDIGFTRLKRALERARSDMYGTLNDALAALVKGFEVAGQPDAALVYLREIKRLHQDGRQAQVLLHHNLHLKRVDAQLDSRAVETLNERQLSLRDQLTDRDLIRSRVALLEQQSVAAELHDDATGEHCYRVGRLSSLLAADYGVDDETRFLIDLAARLHDIGKLAVPDAILLKPGKLTPEERSIMETHTTSGADLLAKSNIAQMYVAEEIARHHHERYDGTGYPARLKGSMIPLAARITALADVFDALTHVRPYKQAWPVDDAMREIARLRGTHFDPELTDLFMELVPRLQREHGDLDAFLGVEAKNSSFIRARRQLAAALKKDVNETFDARR